MRKIFGGIGYLRISVFVIGFHTMGNHGHLMFRSHMTEDWVFWGIAVVTLIIGFIAIFRGVKQMIELSETINIPLNYKLVS